MISALLLLRSGRIRGSGGAVIFIGPLPIVIASNKRITSVIILGVIVLLLILLLVSF